MNRQPAGAEEKEKLYIIAKEKFGEIEGILSYSDALINRKSKDQARLPEAVKCLLEIQDIFLHTLDRRLLVSIQETQSHNPLGIKTKHPNPVTQIPGLKAGINMYTNLCILFKSPPSKTSKIMVSGITNFRFLKCRKYDKEAAADPMLPSWKDLPELRKMVSESMEKIMAVAPDTIPIHQAKPGSSQLQEAMLSLNPKSSRDDFKL